MNKLFWVKILFLISFSMGQSNFVYAAWGSFLGGLFGGGGGSASAASSSSSGVKSSSVSIIDKDEDKILHDALDGLLSEESFKVAELTPFQKELNTAAQKTYTDIDEVIAAFTPFVSRISTQSEDAFAQEIKDFLDYFNKAEAKLALVNETTKDSFLVKFLLIQSERGKGEWFLRLLLNHYKEYLNSDAINDEGKTLLELLIANPKIDIEKLYDGLDCVEKLKQSVVRFDRFKALIEGLLNKVDLTNERIKQGLSIWSVKAFDDINKQVHLGSKGRKEKCSWNAPGAQYIRWDCYERIVGAFDPQNIIYFNQLLDLVAHINGREDQENALFWYVLQHWYQFDSSEHENLKNFVDGILIKQELKYVDWTWKNVRTFNIASVDEKGNTFLHYVASWMTHDQFSRWVPYAQHNLLFEANKDNVTPLALLLSSEDLDRRDFVKWRIQRYLQEMSQDAVKNYKDAHGNTLLHYAAKSRNVELVQLLKETYQVPLTSNDYYETPFCIALQHGFDYEGLKDDRLQGIVLQSALMGQSDIKDYLALEHMFKKNSLGQTVSQWIDAKLAKDELEFDYRVYLEQCCARIDGALETIKADDVAQFDLNDLDSWVEKLYQIKEKYHKYERFDLYQDILSTLDEQLSPAGGGAPQKPGSYLIAHVAEHGSNELMQLLIQDFKFDTKQEINGARLFNIVLGSEVDAVEKVEYLMQDPQFEAAVGDYQKVREKPAGANEWNGVKKQLLELEAPFASDDASDAAELIDQEVYPDHYQALKGNSAHFDPIVASKLNTSDNLGNTPLHYAVKSGNCALVRKMLACGADVEVENNNGNTPLHLACIQNDVALFNVLLTKMPQFISENKKKQRVIDYSKDDHCSIQLKEAIDGYKALWQGMVDDSKDDIDLLKGRYEFLRETNAESASLLFQMPLSDGSGDSLLHKAAKANNVEVLALIVDDESIDLDFKVKHEVKEDEKSEAVSDGVGVAASTPKVKESCSVRELIERVGNPEMLELLEAHDVKIASRELEEAYQEREEQKKEAEKAISSVKAFSVDQPRDFKKEAIRSLKIGGKVCGAIVGLTTITIFLNKVRLAHELLSMENAREIKKTGHPLHTGNLWALAIKKTIIALFSSSEKKKKPAARKKSDESEAEMIEATI